MLECSQNEIYKIIDSINLLHTQGISIFLLSANVGLGKTFLIKEYAKSKGIFEVTSPSFSFIHEYESKDCKIFHYDLYLKNDNSTKEILIESLCKDGLHFIEWGDRILQTNLATLGFASILIEITQNNLDSRIYKIF